MVRLFFSYSMNSASHRLRSLTTRTRFTEAKMPKVPKKKFNQATTAVDPINAAVFLRATKASEAAREAAREAVAGKVATAAKFTTPGFVPEAEIRPKSRTKLKEGPKNTPNTKPGRPETKPEQQAEQKEKTETAPEKETEPEPEPEPELIPEPVVHTKVFAPSKPVPKGHKTVLFQSTTDWTSRFEKDVGYKIRSTTFGSRFVLEEYVLSILHTLEHNAKSRYSKHIDDLLFLGPRVCQTLQHFRLEHKNIDDVCQNRFDASDDNTMRFAEACPELKEVQIQGATKLTDGAVYAFLANCPPLTKLEVSSHYKQKILLEGGFFASLQRRGDLVTELKILRVDGDVPSSGKTSFMHERDACSVKGPNNAVD